MKTQYPNTPKCPVCDVPMQRTKGGGLQCGRVKCCAGEEVIFKTVDGMTRRLALPGLDGMIGIPYLSRKLGVGFSVRCYEDRGETEYQPEGYRMRVFNEVES